MLTSVDVGRVVLYQPTPEQHTGAKRRAERLNLEVGIAACTEEMLPLLGAPGQSVLVLCEYTPEARAVARCARGPKGWGQLPVFALLPDELIDGRVLKQANDQRIELLPASLPECRRWQRVREALESSRVGKRWAVHNKRAHFRLPLKAKATLLADAETVDISEGGVAFESNQRYAVGDAGRIDIRPLLGDMEEVERGFAFEVVSVKPLRRGPFRYLIGARFTDLAEAAQQRLKDALELIEPTETAD